MKSMAQGSCVETQSNLSNTVNTAISHAQINTGDGGFVKTVNKAYTDIGEVVTYTLVLKNTGNTTATNVVFTDTIPPGTTFVANSVILNSIPQGGANPQNGIGIGVLGPNQVATLVFQVAVGTNPNPNPNPIPNQGAVSYNYTVNPSVPNGGTGNGVSNVVNTTVNHAQFSGADGGIVKGVSRAYADVGDTLTYTLVLKNTGSATALNAVVYDTIPNGTTLIPNTLTINGALASGSNPQTGINLGTIAAGQVNTVLFQVKVTTIPVPNPIPNNANMTYGYIVDPSLQIGKTGSGSSNTVNTQINNASIPAPNKTVSPPYADVGNTVTYTINMKNSGNVTATNVIVTDSIPSGTSLVANSVTVNGIVQPDANPQTGVNVGSLAPNTGVTVQFVVLVQSTPTTNPITNIAQVSYNYTIDPSNPNGGSNSTPSKPSNNYINHGDLTAANGGIQKSANKNYAAVGETIVYTLKMTNQGNVAVNNVFVYDTLPNGISLVPGSIAVNGAQQAAGDLITGVNVGTIAPQNTTTVTFIGLVNTIPTPNPAPNNFDVGYTYTVNPSVPNGVSKRNTSNTIQTQINDARIGDGPNSFKKTPSKAYADVGDTITYTVFLANTGNVPGNNIVLRDTIPSGTSFITNSVIVNGTQIPGANPQNGVNIGTLNPGQSATIAFSVLVTTVPNPNPIPNQASLSYTYTKDPSVPNGQPANGTSNTSNTQVNHGQVPSGGPGGFNKTSNTQYAKRGDVVTYTFSVPNTGNVPIFNTVISDTLPQGVQFVPNSVTVNSVSIPTANPNNGINLGTIPAQSVTTVTYQVLVTSIPSGGVLTNQGTINYQYIVDPSLPPANGSGSSNQNKVPINDARINGVDGGFVKSVDNPYAQVGDTLTYTIRVNNTGNVSALNVIITDTIPQGTNFVANSVTVNGVTTPNANPQNGINLGTVGPNSPVTITFKTVVTSIPTNNLILNVASSQYQFIMDPSKPAISATGNTNPVTTTVSSADFRGDNFKKSSTPYYVAIGDTVTYTFNITNGGNATASSTTFFDTIPSGTVFVPNSVTVNGVTQSGVNPQQGINLQDIVPGENTSITFKVVVTSIPNPNPAADTASLNYSLILDPTKPPVNMSTNSNTIYNQVNSVDIQFKKYSEPAAAVVGDTVTYTLVVKNNGNVPALNTEVEDILPPQLQFIPGSVTINGAAEPKKNIVNGVSLETLAAGQTATITFKALILSAPTNGKIENQAVADYEFVVDPSLPPRPGRKPSNPYDLTVGVAELKLTKVADKKEVVLGETITYTVTVTNTGTVDATNVIIDDTLPEGTAFVPNSFSLNGIPINGLSIEDGFNIGTLKPGQTDVITYQVKLERVCGCGQIINAVTAKFNYIAAPGTPKRTKVAGPVSTLVTAVSPAFKQLDLDAVLVVPCPKPDIEEVSGVSAQATVTDYHIIETITGVSAENTTLTGYKLIVNGILKIDLEYISDQCESMNMAAFERRFATYIVLPEDVDLGAAAEIAVDIEDVYYRQLNCREVFANVTLLVRAQVSC